MSEMRAKNDQKGGPLALAFDRLAFSEGSFSMPSSNVAFSAQLTAALSHTYY